MNCVVCDCGEPMKAKGYCIRHYHRWRRYGDPQAGRVRRDATPVERFNRIGWIVMETGCHEWRGYRFPNGYGQFGRGVYAHRFSYSIRNGDIPNGISILHRCDNPPCVKPEHLFAGTVQDNSDDMCRKGRSANGERAGQCKLTDVEVAEIRARYTAGGISQRQLAEQFHTTQSNVSLVVRHVNRATPTNWMSNV